MMLVWDWNSQVFLHRQDRIHVSLFNCSLNWTGHSSPPSDPRTPRVMGWRRMTFQTVYPRRPVNFPVLLLAPSTGTRIHRGCCSFCPAALFTPDTDEKPNSMYLSDVFLSIFIVIIIIRALEGPPVPPPLFFDQNEAQRAEKNFFGDRPPYLRVWMTPPPLLSEGLDRPLY